MHFFSYKLLIKLLNHLRDHFEHLLKTKDENLVQIQEINISK